MISPHVKFLRRSKFIAPFLFGIFFLLFPSTVFAYASKTTHPHLTRQAAVLFNKTVSDPSSPFRSSPARNGSTKGRSNELESLSNEAIGWLAQGAADEDLPPRWLNHYYDPVTGEGWNGEGVTAMNAETIRGLSALGLSYEKAESAKTWAQDSSAQMLFALYGGDQTWQKAVSEYVKGNRKNAFIALGHVLHLLQDMTVPEHTRNDTHLGIAGDPASPYETAAQNYQVSPDKIEMTNLNDLDDYFDILADYSNKNFVSENSIFKYPIGGKLSENQVGGKLFMILDNSVDKYPLYFKKQPGIDDVEYSVNDERILTAYWSRLAPKAVGAGAGVINLFFKEVEEAKKNPEKYKTVSALAMLSNIKQGRLPLISIFGEMARVERTFTSTIAFLKNLYTGSKAEETSPPVTPVVPLTLPLAVENEAKSVIPPKPAAPPKNLPIQKNKNFENDEDAAPTASSTPLIAVPQIKVTEATSTPTSIIEASGSLVLADQSLDNTEDDTEPPPVYIPPLTHMGPAKDEEPPPDTTPPLAPTVILPTGEASYLTNKTHLIFSGEKSDDTIAIIFSLDGVTQLITDFVSSTTWTNEIDFTEGEHTISVQAKDAVGNASGLITLDVTVDTTAPVAPIILSPTTEASFITNQTHLDLIGTKSEDVVAILLSLDGVDSFANFDSATKWYKSFALDAGSHTLAVKAKDAAGNASAAVMLNIIMDAAPPAVNFAAIDSVQKHREFLVSWSGMDKISAENSDEQAVKYFDIDWRDMSTSTYESWFIATTSASAVFAGDNGHTYRFRVRATDAAGNVSEWSESADIAVRLPHVVISEVKIGGANATDEFVELYNPADEAVSLTGWKLQKLSVSGQTRENLLTSFPSATIPAHGFYLVTHPAGYTGNVSPDAVYSTQSSLASNNTVILYNGEGVIIDKLGFGAASEFEGAPAAGVSSGNSLERKASAASTAESMSLGGNEELAGNGENTDGNAADFILRANPEPQNSESLPEPRANDDRPASIADLRAALVETTASSVKLLWSTPADAKLGEDAIYDILYAPQPLPTGCILNILWNEASRVVPNPVPADSVGAAESLVVSGLSPNTYYCFAVKTWNGYCWSDLSNLYVVRTLKTGGTLAARGTFLPNPVSSATTLTPDNNPHIVDGSVWVKAKLTILPGVIVKFKPYFYGQTGQLTSRLLFSGGLEARGTAENPIIFTSLYDDRFGGDTDGAAHTPAKGDWAFLDFTSATTAPAVIDYADFYFGGDSTGTGNSGGAIYSLGLRPLSVSNSFFENNHAGIVGRNATGAASLTPLIVKNSIFRANTSGLRVLEGMIFDASGNSFENNNIGFYGNGLRADSAVLRYNNFSGNTSYGAQNQGTVSLDASGNWWGAATGPKHASNPAGAGDKVSDKIDFSPWSDARF